MAKRPPKVLLSDDPLEPEDILPPKRRDPERGEPGEPSYAPDEEGFTPVPDDDEEPEDSEPEDDDSDYPEDLPPPPNPANPGGGERPGTSDIAADAPHGDGAAPGALARPPTPVTTYRSRISVVEAWQYPGSLTQAPPFVDRSWTGWNDSGGLQGQPAGPALRVPVARSLAGPTPSDGIKMCLVGDYVVRQNVTLADGLEPEEVVDVWPRDDFERLFIPSKVVVA